MDKLDELHKRLKEPPAKAKYSPLSSPESPPSDPEPWPELIPLDQQDPAPAFPLDIYTKNIRNLIETTTKDTRAPLDYAAVTVLSTAAAAIGATCVAVGKGEWTEQPALWIGLIGPPGVKKTPSMNIVQKPLKKINKRRILLAKDRDADEKVTGIEPRQYANDEGMILMQECTAEGIMSIYARQRRGLIYTRSEISGWMRGMGQYKQSGGNDRQLWLELYDGGSYHKVNLSSQIHCDNVCLNICGGIQPGIVDTFLDQSDGLDARFLWSWPDACKATPEDGHTADKQIIDRWEAILERIFGKSLQECGEENKYLQPVKYYMDRAAWECWKKFTQWQADILNDETTTPKIRDWIGKAEGFGLRIAITLRILAEADNENRKEFVIEELDIERTAALMKYFYGMALRVYGVTKNNEETERIKKLVAWMQRRLQDGEHAFTERDVLRGNPTRYDGMASVKCDLWKLKDYGFIREVTTDKRRKDSCQIWEINPAVKAV